MLFSAITIQDHIWQVATNVEVDVAKGCCSVVSSSNTNTSIIIHIHGRVRAGVTKEMQPPLLESLASRAPVVTAFNLFILWDSVTGQPRVIKKCSKGRWINKGLYELLPELWEGCLFPLASYSCSARTSRASAVPLHRTIHVFLRWAGLFLRHISCYCKSETINYRKCFSMWATDKIYFMCQHQYPLNPYSAVLLCY